jgi:protein involved in polysaccharide export with SLBB domain
MKRFTAAIAVALVFAGCVSPPRPDTIATGESLRITARMGAMELEPVSCTVNREGSITLPLLGAFPAAGKTASALEVEIRRTYLDQCHYIHGPSFMVEVTRVTGNENRSGEKRK